MTTLRLEARKAELAREILNIDNADLLNEVRKFYQQAKTRMTKEPDTENIEPYTMKEIDARIDRSESDIAAGRVKSAKQIEQELRQYISTI